MKVKIYITDPWDSKEIIEGTLYGEVFIDNLKSALIHSDKKKWLVLLPRYKGQNILDDLADGKDTVTNIVWLSEKFDETTIDISRDLVISYNIGNAIQIK
jgi:hypothetical protein